jgi:hypothetical protein
MPYIARGHCVYRKDTGKKVGCTKGSIKAYMAALHANVKDIKEGINSFNNLYNKVLNEDNYTERQEAEREEFKKRQRGHQKKIIKPLSHFKLVDTKGQSVILREDDILALLSLVTDAIDSKIFNNELMDLSLLEKIKDNLRVSLPQNILSDNYDKLRLTLSTKEFEAKLNKPFPSFSSNTKQIPWDWETNAPKET